MCIRGERDRMINKRERKRYEQVESNRMINKRERERVMNSLRQTE